MTVDYFKHSFLTQKNNMGFNKLFLPELAQLKTQLKEEGVDQFTEHWKRRYAKTDAIMGPIGSDEFIKQFLNREYNYRTTGQLEFDFDWSSI